MRARALQKGFTAIETMVVVAILAILAAFAAPSMSQLLRTQKVRSAAYDIYADLTYARSEAIARGHDVMVMSSGGTNSWQPGWVIRDLASGETLRVQNALATNLDFDGDASSITFDRSGRTTSLVKFDIAPHGVTAPVDQKRCVRISPSGRPNSLTGVCP